MPGAAINSLPPEHPPKADLRKQLYRPFPVIENAPSFALSPEDAMAAAQTAVASLAAALASGDVSQVAACFYAGQSYWKDTVALTYHFRTFEDAKAPSSLAHLAQLRGVDGFMVLPGTVRCIPLMPSLTFIDGFFAFTTASPAAQCGGNFMLVPDNGIWKFWTLGTWLDSFVDHPWDPERLKAPARDVSKEKEFETDVFIVGGGNSGVCLGARLKDLGVDYMIIDSNAHHGDNWRLRYDQMKFHLPKCVVQTPYIPYADSLPRMMTRDILADQVELLVTQLKLNVLLSSHVKSTLFDSAKGRWKLVIETPYGEKTVLAKQLVQATGVGSRKPYVPDVENKDAYKGISMHSTSYKNAKELADKGVKTALVVGSANTGFDLLEDCCEAGIATTLLQRSPTYVIPVSYLDDPNGFGAYEMLPADIVDKATMGGPIAVGAQLIAGLHAMKASAEPDRFKAARANGLQVVDVGGDIMHNLFERAGGHYVDMAGLCKGTDIIADGLVSVKSGVTPVAYTKDGLKLSDGSEVKADAILWCTGMADKDARVTTSQTFGEGGDGIANKIDATWGLDKEGEVRGLWKRQTEVENFWMMGGFTTHHRYHSKTLALQLKAAVEGFIPEAYKA